MTTLNDLNGYLDDEAYTVRVGELRALLSASIADTATEPTDLLPNALWTRRGSGTDEWWSFKGYQARKDAADQWVLRKGGEELYRHTYLQVAMAHAERQILASAESIADTAGAKPVLSTEVCARDVFEKGQSIGLFDIPKHTANEICAGISAATGACVDWHYIAGRVHIKALAAPPAPSVADAAGASDAERYRWIATLQDWRDIERMCWSSTAKSAAQFKADLDKYIDAAIAKESK